MNYWKRVPLDSFPLIQRKALEFVRANVNLTTAPFWSPLSTTALLKQVPELGESVKKALNTRIWLATALVLQKPQSSRHVDHIVGQRNQQARLNIPLLNCEQSETNFYDVGDTKPDTQFPTGVKHWNWEHDFPIVSQVILSEPTILRVTAVHAVRSFSDQLRLALTLNLEEDPVVHLDNPAP